MAVNYHNVDSAKQLAPNTEFDEGLEPTWFQKVCIWFNGLPHWVIGGVLALVSFVLAAATAGLGFALASTIIGGAIGAGYGAITAAYTKQDVKTSALLGMISGIIMGNTALAGSKLFATNNVMNVTKNVNKGVGVLLSFVGGIAAGAYSEYSSQTIKYGGIIDKKAIFISAMEYGTVNILSMFTGVLTNDVVGLEAGFGIYIFDLIMSTATLAIDVLRNL